MKNILFIIPHPDDEIVGSCCIIKRYISNKKISCYFLSPMELFPKALHGFGIKKKSKI